MEYYEQLLNQERPLLPADKADERLEKLEAVYREALKFLLYLESQAGDFANVICPGLAKAIKDATE